MMEPTAILLASPPSDNGPQRVSGILESSETMSPTYPTGCRQPMNATHNAGLLSTGILEDGSDLDGGWVIEAEEGPGASRGHHLTRWR